jgi:1,2-diacylglycerol 3-beta-glucosyltransferase
MQYVLPLLSGADLVGALVTRTAPLMWPFSIVTMGLSGVAIVRGSRRSSEGPSLPAPTPLQLALTLLYLSHWLIVIPWVTLRMALLPKRLIWAKTIHHGAKDSPFPGEPTGTEADPAADGDHELATEIGNF